MNSVRAVLFDLDGTILDTAPDLGYTMNQLRKEHGLPELSMDIIRPIVSFGSKAMVKLALGIEETHPDFENIRQYFLNIYENNLALSTVFFPEMEAVLAYLDDKHIPWGIVTNKLTHHTTILLKALSFHHRPACIICGDSLATRKPDPAPILHACDLLKYKPQDCLYIGDCVTDVMASKAAGTKSLVALYGYIGNDENPLTWEADGYIKTPREILNWLNK